MKSDEKKNQAKSEIEIMDWAGTIDDYRRAIGIGMFDKAAIFVLGMNADGDVHILAAHQMLTDDEKANAVLDSKPFEGKPGFAYIVRYQTDKTNVGTVLDSRFDNDDFRVHPFMDLTQSLMERRLDTMNAERAKDGLAPLTKTDEIFRKPLRHAELKEAWGLATAKGVANLRTPKFSNRGDRKPLQHIVLLDDRRGAIGFCGTLVCYVALSQGRLPDDMRWQFAGNLAKTVTFVSHQMGDVLVATIRGDNHQAIDVSRVSTDTPTAITVGPQLPGDGLLIGTPNGMRDVLVTFPRDKKNRGRIVKAVGRKHDQAPPVARELQLSV